MGPTFHVDLVPFVTRDTPRAEWLIRDLQRRILNGRLGDPNLSRLSWFLPPAD